MCCRVGKCCFCIDLRVGIITIACIWLLGDALLLVWTSHLAYVLNAAMEELRSEDFEDADPESSGRVVAAMILAGAFWMAVIGAVLSSLAVLLDIMLLAGAINARRKLLHGWMVAYAVLYGVSLVIGGLSVTVVFLYNSSYYGLSITAGMLLHVGLMVYFWIVVRSYYLELGQQYGEDGPRTTAGKVYRTVPTGDVLPAHGTYCYADGMAMAPTAPPRYTSAP
ncbi:uncharacterized protein LOC124550976 [Schistocerca americana]|uniref:uncharacterized protein LOC124550976 n=1 Tax=Schistocerca americana TaxID=7009 RepID=UPI001F5021BD|nr:uncharacterized protein LOC124550976 [Schistocerca americana]